MCGGVYVCGGVCVYVGVRVCARKFNSEAGELNYNTLSCISYGDAPEFGTLSDVCGCYLLILLSFLLPLPLGLYSGSHLLDWVASQRTVELPQYVMHNGRLLHLLQQPLQKLQGNEPKWYH